jgi:hypothetical protein
MWSILHEDGYPGVSLILTNTVAEPLDFALWRRSGAIHRTTTISSYRLTGEAKVN